MKIALVHMRHAHAGGTERYLNLLARHLCERGDEVIIVCRSHETSPHPRARFVVLHSLALGAARRYTVFAREVERHVATHAYDVVFGLGRTYTQDVVRLGGGCHQTHLERAHEPTRGPLERVLGLGRSKHRTALALEQRTLAPGAYRRVIVNSQMVLEDVVRRFQVPREKLDVIYNGADVERFHPRLRATSGAALRSAWGFTSDDFVLLFLGSGYARKGLDLLLRALATVMPDKPRLRLAVVGYDSSAPRYEAMAGELGIADRVRFLGGRRDAEACYAASDLYVLPTRYDPGANASVEAMAAGLAVITSTSNGSGELVVPGRSGALIDDLSDARALAAELERWSEHERARAGGHAARITAEAHSSEVMCRASASVLDRVASEKQRGVC
jgi:UDP-glucose:(heptosyl)LPS alpha-1,3-glucosyltransferase